MQTVLKANLFSNMEAFDSDRLRYTPECKIEPNVNGAD